MGGERRAKLPSADELFRATGPRPSESDEGRTVRDVDSLVVAELSELAADEDAALDAARARRGLEAPPTPAVGSLLAWLAAGVDGRSLVEVGCSGGLTGLWLLRGARPRATLTSVEGDPTERDLAAQAFTDAGVADRVRRIAGAPAEVLPRLSDAGYDLVVVSDVSVGHRELREHAMRLLRPGGTLVVLDVASGDDDARRQRRSLVRELIDDDRLQVTVLPVDGGVALARRRSPD